MYDVNQVFYRITSNKNVRRMQIYSWSRDSLRLTLFYINRYCFAELSPVCAVVGGVLGQEIIKVSENVHQ